MEEQGQNRKLAHLQNALKPLTHRFGNSCSAKSGERHDAPCFGRFIFLISLHCGSVFGMSEQARKAYFRVAVKHPGKTRWFYVVMDLKNLEGETLRYPKMRAAKAIKLLFKCHKANSEKAVKPRCPK